MQRCHSRLIKIYIKAEQENLELAKLHRLTAYRLAKYQNQLLSLLFWNRHITKLKSHFGS